MFSSKIIGCGLLFVLCLVGASKAASMSQDEFQEDEPQDYQTMDDEQDVRMKEILGLLQNVQSLLDPGNETETDADTDTETELEDPAANLRCRCHRQRCSCCRRINVRGYFCKQVCLNIVYLRHCRAFLTTLRVGGRIVFSQVVHVSHPRPVCARFRVARKKHVSVCLRMNHMRITRGCVSGCDAFVLRWNCHQVVRVRLGCFSFNRRSALMSATHMPNGLCSSAPKSLENLLQQEEENVEEGEEEQVTPVPESKDFEADMIKDIEELYQQETEDDVFKMVNIEN